MARDLFLGIDIGTGGVRACAIDAEVQIAGFGQVALPPPRQDGDAIDQDPDFVSDGVGLSAPCPDDLFHVNQVRRRRCRDCMGHS